MRCFSCNCQVGDSSFRDAPTGRFYCETCREIIWNTIDKMSPREDNEDDLTLMFERFEELPLEDNYQEFNLPVDDYYE